MTRKKSSAATPKRRGAAPKSGSSGKNAPTSSVGSRISPKKEARLPASRRVSKRKAAASTGGGGNSGPPKRRSGRGGFWGWVGSSLFIILIFMVFGLLIVATNLPSVEGLESLERQPGVIIKSEDGITLASYGDVYGDYIPYEAIPPSLLRAVLATEDRRFFEHFGIDVPGIMRAMWVNLQAGRVVQGGSTITQQVAKNIFLTPERSLKRKLQEMMLAFWLEANFSKEQILAIYLNRVYLGSGNYGIDAASKRYFDKPATEINLIESAILTGLLKAPSRYSPLSSTKRAQDRAHQVLLNMVDAGYISPAEVQEALAAFTPPKLYREGDASGSRYFTDWVVDEVPMYVGSMQGDLVVISTLDTTLQKEAEDALTGIMNEQGEEKRASQAALISMRPDGAIEAMVGGRSYSASQYNRATQAVRQPGSVFKLFVYLAALDAGMPTDLLIEDKPLAIPDNRRNWRPGNFDGRFHGWMPMYEALARSVNTVAVQLALAVGMEQVASMASRLGMDNITPRPSIALGAVDGNLLNLTSAYAHLANRGRGVQPYGIKAIYTQSGKPLYVRSGSGFGQVLRDSVVRSMTGMLQQVPLEGTGRRAYIGRPMAGKTGTSSDYRDAWFIGFTPQLVTGVWVGNDDNSQMKKVTGGNLPAMIWNAYMGRAMEGLPVMPLYSSDPSAADQLLPWQSRNEQTLEQWLAADAGRSRQEFPMTPQERRRMERRGELPPPPSGPQLDRGFWDTLFGQ